MSKKLTEWSPNWNVLSLTTLREMEHLADYEYRSADMACDIARWHKKLDTIRVLIHKRLNAHTSD